MTYCTPIYHEGAMYTLATTVYAWCYLSKDGVQLVCPLEQLIVKVRVLLIQ